MFNNWNKSDVLIFLSLVYSAKKNFLVDPGELCSSQGLNYHESLSLSLLLFNALSSVDNHAPTNQKKTFHGPLYFCMSCFVVTNISNTSDFIQTKN